MVQVQCVELMATIVYTAAASQLAKKIHYLHTAENMFSV